MKKFTAAVIIVFVVGSLSFSSTKSIEYQLEKNFHRLKVVLNGDVRWNVSQNDNAFEITLMGDESYFIAKNISCSFLHGIIKSFNYKTTLPGTKKIFVDLRANVTDYNIYQNDVTKELFIEFYPGSWVEERSAKSIAVKTPETKKPELKKTEVKEPETKEPIAAAQPKQSVVNISQIVLDQVEQQPKKETEVQIPAAAEQQRSVSTSSAALWLILLSISIVLTGGGLTVYAFVRRKSSLPVQISRTINAIAPEPPGFTIVRHDSGPIISSLPVHSNSSVEQDETEISHARDLSEQYFRSRGELELQQGLENMSARSIQHKIGSAIPATGKKDYAAVAQKLGLSVGELELVTRLQKFHKQHSSEVS